MDEPLDINALPTVIIQFEPKTQNVRILFDNAKFPGSWAMITGILEMALNEAEFHANMLRMAAIQQQQMEAQSIAEKLRRGPRSQ